MFLRVLWGHQNDGADWVDMGFLDGYTSFGILLSKTVSDNCRVHHTTSQSLNHHTPSQNLCSLPSSRQQVAYHTLGNQDAVPPTLFR